MYAATRFLGCYLVRGISSGADKTEEETGRMRTNYLDDKSELGIGLSNTWQHLVSTKVRNDHKERVLP